MVSFCNRLSASWIPVWLTTMLIAVVWMDVNVVFVGGADIEGNRRASGNRNLIINGDPVDPSNYPFFVRSWPDRLIQTADVLCGASLIHSDMILTAAHCQGAFNFGAMAYDPVSGKLDRLKTVDLQVVYPKYYEKPDMVNYDIMVMRLSSPITDVVPVSLNTDPDFPIMRKPKKNDVPSYISHLEAIGVGITETGAVSAGLKTGLFSPLTVDQCVQRLQTSVTNAAITEDLLCADPSIDASICLGDSGGPLTAWIEAYPSVEASPLVAKSPWVDSRESSTVETAVPVQVGVTSFGNNCQSDVIPDGFARVSYFADWINEHICKHSRSPPATCSDYFQSEDYLAYQAEQDPTAVVPVGKAKMTLDFQHDFLAEDTVFVIRNALKGTVEYTGPQYIPQRGERSISNFWLPVPGNYILEVYDAGGDGLTNPNFIQANFLPGNWTISAEYNNGARLEHLSIGDPVFESLSIGQFQLPSVIASSSSTMDFSTENDTNGIRGSSSASVHTIHKFWTTIGCAFVLAWGMVQR